MRAKALILILVSLMLAEWGCQKSPPRDNLTLNRGVQMLVAGSPKFAIPLLSQVIASEPDGPEPPALLALAYALDLQPDLAIRQAQRVQRDPKTDGEAGWEHVALGVAAMTQHRSADAVKHLQTVIAASAPDSPVRTAAEQWLTLALLLGGDYETAVESLDNALRADSQNTTAMLWLAVVHGRRGKNDVARENLARLAATVLEEIPMNADGPADLTAADPQVVCNAAIAAIAAKDYARARKAFAVLHTRGDYTWDFHVWLAMMTAAEGHWSQATELLKGACQDGSNRSRSLAHQLLCVVSAAENRPQQMIQHMLVGQRLQRRHLQATQPPPQATPENVWLSDKLN